MPLEFDGTNRSHYFSFFNLFCCPPCPGNIVSKLAFFPPPPTYKFITSADSGLKLSLLNLIDQPVPLSNDDLKNIEVAFVRPRQRHRIASVYVKCRLPVKKTILFSHGNAVDIGVMMNCFLFLAESLKCNIFGYDYSGYGLSEGKPLERNVYADIEAAFNFLMETYSIQRENVILYGQSIGTAPTIHLASKEDVGGVILHSPLTSAIRVAFPQTTRSWFFDSFSNIEKVPKIKAPVLVIHGTKDEVIDFSHGQAIHEKCPNPVEPLWVEGAGHNNVEQSLQYMPRLQKFIDFEITQRF